MPFDIEGALREGYTYPEIASLLSKRRKFNLEGAVAEGYGYDEIATLLSQDVSPTGGVGESLIGGAKRLGSSILTAGEMPFLGADEAATRGLARKEAITERPGYSQEAIDTAFDEAGGGLPGYWAGAKEFVSQVPSAAAEQAANLGLSLGTARAAVAVTPPVLPVVGPFAKPIAGLVGAFLPSAIPQLGTNVERQAQEDITAGRPVDVEVSKALPGAAAQGALDVVGLKFGLGRLLGLPATKMGTEAAEKIMQQSLITAGTIGVGKTMLAELPTEVTQQVIERWQAGLPLTTDDALAEYRVTAMQTAAGIGPFGALNAGATRSEARQVLDADQVEKAQTVQDITNRQNQFQDLYARRSAEAEQDEADILGREAIRAEMEKFDADTQQRVVDTLARVRGARNEQEVASILQDEDETRQILEMLEQDKRDELLAGIPFDKAKFSGRKAGAEGGITDKDLANQIIAELRSTDVLANPDKTISRLNVLKDMNKGENDLEINEMIDEFIAKNFSDLTERTQAGPGPVDPQLYETIRPYMPEQKQLLDDTTRFTPQSEYQLDLLHPGETVSELTPDTMLKAAEPLKMEDVLRGGLYDPNAEGRQRGFDFGQEPSGEGVAGDVLAGEGPRTAGLDLRGVGLPRGTAQPDTRGTGAVASPLTDERGQAWVNNLNRINKIRANKKLTTPEKQAKAVNDIAKILGNMGFSTRAVPTTFDAEGNPTAQRSPAMDKALEITKGVWPAQPMKAEPKRVTAAPDLSKATPEEIVRHSFAAANAALARAQKTIASPDGKEIMADANQIIEHAQTSIELGDKAEALNALQVLEAMEGSKQLQAPDMASVREAIAEARDHILTASDQPIQASRRKNRRSTKGQQYKQARTIAPSETPATVLDIEETLAEMFPAKRLAANKPIVVENYDGLDSYVATGELTAADVAAARNGAKAFVKGGKRDFYIADLIPSNYIKGTIMHERGVHMGLVNLIGQPRINGLANRVETMEKNGTAVEKQIAKEAIDMALDSGEEIGSDRFNQELVAYFTEVAVNKYGIDPLKTQPKEYSRIAQWLKDLWTSALNAVKKLQMDPNSLTSKDIVDLVYGAARLEGIDGVTQGEVAGEMQASKAPEGVDQKIWDLHEKARQADAYAADPSAHPLGKSRGITEGALKRNQTMSFRRLNDALKTAGYSDDDAVKLMTQMNMESRQREDGDIQASFSPLKAMQQMQEAVDDIVEGSTADNSALMEDADKKSEMLVRYAKNLRRVQALLDNEPGILRNEDGKPVVLYRGQHKYRGDDRLLKARTAEDMAEQGYKDTRAYAVFSTDNPFTASTFADSHITPFVVYPDKIVEYKDKGFLGFDEQARKLKKGEVLVWRDMYDRGPTDTGSVHPATSLETYTGDQYAFTDSRIATPLMDVLSDINEKAGKHYRGTDRTGIQASKAQLDTPQFKKWFGASKIVDEKGKPLVVYHGSPVKGIRKFKIGRDGGALGSGIYFTPDESFANEYTASGQGEVTDAYISMQNPLIIESDNTQDPAIQLLMKLGVPEEKAVSIIEKAYDTVGYPTTQIKKRAQDAGYDGIIQKRNGKIREIVAFNSRQIKSASKNTGEFDVWSEDIQASKIAQPTAAEIAAEHAAGRRVYINKPAPTYRDKFNHATGGTLDVFLRKAAVKLVGGSESLALRGIPMFGSETRINPDTGHELGYLNYHRNTHDTELATGAVAEGYLDFDKEGVAHIKEAPENIHALNDQTNAIKQKMMANGMSEAMANSRFAHMVLADRFKVLQQMGELGQDQFSAADYQLGKDMQRQYAKEFQEWQRIYQTIRGRTMRAMVQSGTFTAQKAKDFLDRLEYIPFNREQELNETDAGFLRSLLSTKAERHLKGGSESPVADVMGNIIDNQVWLLKRAVRNNAANLVAETMESMNKRNPLMGGHFIPADDGSDTTVSLLVNGQIKWFKGMDKTDMAIFSAAPIVSSTALRVMRSFTGALRKGVTLMPSFHYNQIIQDAMRAPLVAGTKAGMAGLLKTSAPEFWNNIRKETPLAKQLRRAGIIGQIDYQDTYDNWKKEVLGNERKGLSRALEIGERVAQSNDLATRAAVYNDILKETGDANEASLRALMMINFQNRGHSATMNFLMATVPFVNSRIQGEYRLLMALTGKMPGVTKAQAREYVAWRLAKLAAFTMLYAMAVGGDDDYEKANEDVRNNNFLLNGWRVPVAPELLPLKIGVEKAYRLATDSEFETGAKAFRAEMGAVAGLFLGAGDVTPTALRPLIENLTNYSFFTGRNLVGTHQLSMDTKQQFNDTTSAFSKAISAGLDYAGREAGVGGNVVNVAPIKIDNIVRGWFGSMGRDFLTATDMLAGTRPDMKFNQTPIIGAISYDMEGGALKSDFYELKDKSDRAKATFNELKNKDKNAAIEYLAENRRMIAVNSQINNIEKYLSKIREMKQRIRKEDPDRARERISELEAQVHERLKMQLPVLMQRVQEE